ncbi:hypothetical protein [Lignipirellula cremea]|nr:hypothetical protein [Lignipirellula cremea]
MSVLLKVHGSTPARTLLPIVKRVDWGSITYALDDKPGIAIIFRIRSDVKIIEARKRWEESRRERAADEPSLILLEKESLDQLKADLLALGADSVSLETTHVLRTAEFSIASVEELRKQRRRVIIICHADWDAPSAGLEENLLLNKDVVSAAKESNAVVMVVNMTTPLRDEFAKYFEARRAKPFCFLIFDPGKEDPVLITKFIRPEEFIALLDADE